MTELRTSTSSSLTCPGRSDVAERCGWLTRLLRTCSLPQPQRYDAKPSVSIRNGARSYDASLSFSRTFDNDRTLESGTKKRLRLDGGINGEAVTRVECRLRLIGPAKRRATLELSGVGELRKKCSDENQFELATESLSSGQAPCHYSIVGCSQSSIASVTRALRSACLRLSFESESAGLGRTAVHLHTEVVGFDIAMVKRSGRHSGWTEIVGGGFPPQYIGPLVIVALDHVALHGDVNALAEGPASIGDRRSIVARRPTGRPADEGAREDKDQSDDGNYHQDNKTRDRGHAGGC